MRQAHDQEKPEVPERLPVDRLPLVGAIAISLLVRIPSLWDPPWVNDEGTYFAVAQAISHGFRLYADIWENKPPALYLLYDVVYRAFGPSLLTVRLVAMVAATGTVVLVWRLARHYLDAEHAVVAALLAGLLLAVPFLEGTTANAELFLALLSSTAVYLAVIADRPVWSAVVMAAAILFKVVGVFDALALGIWLIVCRPRSAVSFILALATSLAGAGALASVGGILSPMWKDAFLYDIGYVGHGNGGGLPWVLGVKMALLVLLFARARHAAYPYLWLLFSTAGALVSGRLFGHYLIQVVPSLAIVLALQTTRFSARALLAVLLAAYTSFAAIAGLGGWALAASGHDSILARRLQYYPNFFRFAVGMESYEAYSAQVDDHVNRNLRVARTLRASPPGRILIWGNVPWVYVLSDRLPATPYTSALRSPEVPGETDALRAVLERGLAREVIVIEPPAPPVGAAARFLAARYRLSARVDNAAVYVSAR